MHPIAILIHFTAAIWVEISKKEQEVHFKNEIYLYPLIFGGVITLGEFEWTSSVKNGIFIMLTK